MCSTCWVPSWCNLGRSLRSAGLQESPHQKWSFRSLGNSLNERVRKPWLAKPLVLVRLDPLDTELVTQIGNRRCLGSFSHRKVQSFSKVFWKFITCSDIIDSWNIIRAQGEIEVVATIGQWVRQIFHLEGVATVEFFTNPWGASHAQTRPQVSDSIGLSQNQWLQLRVSVWSWGYPSYHLIFGFSIPKKPCSRVAPFMDPPTIKTRSRWPGKDPLSWKTRSEEEPRVPKKDVEKTKTSKDSWNMLEDEKSLDNIGWVSSCVIFRRLNPQAVW